jgi:hypothetical protein
MVQIAFLTLFLGLLTGSHPVQLAVSGPVAAVELLLDGAPVGTLSGPPWVQRIDLGSGLLPHELVARALDAGGHELARARQWVNLPRPAAEVSIAVEEGGKTGPSAVQLAWQALAAGAPTRISLTLDGEPLAVDRGGRATLPKRNLDVSHVLSAEVEFAPGVVARRDVVLGAQGGEAFGELTAVPVLVRRGDLPPVDKLQGWFTSGGKPLRPVAAERGDAQVIVVRDAGAREAFTGMAPARRRIYGPPNTQLGSGDRVRFLWPSPRYRDSSGVPAELFDSSREFTRRDGGLLYMLSDLSFQGNQERSGQRLADALAVAGIEALAGNHPRAVVLVLGRTPEDGSRNTPASIRRFLAALRVPLYVWSLAPSSPAAAAWGPVEDVSNGTKLATAVERLREDLEAQHIVFLEGLHLPQSIALSPTAAGIELP